MPYLQTLAPAVYRLFGIAETYDYLAASLGEDPAPLIEAGTSSDDWLTRRLRRVLARLRAAVLHSPRRSRTRRPPGVSRREAVREGVVRAEAMHAEMRAGFAHARAARPDHRLTRSVADYVAQDAEAARGGARARRGARVPREATRAEALDATHVPRVLPHAVPRRGVPPRGSWWASERLADELGLPRRGSSATSNGRARSPSCRSGRWSPCRPAPVCSRCSAGRLTDPALRRTRGPPATHARARRA